MANPQNLKPFNKGADPRRGSKPKGSKHLSTWIQELLNDEGFEIGMLDSNRGYILYKGAPIKAIVGVAIQRALNDPKDGIKWATWLATFGYGRKVEVEPNRGLPQPILLIKHSRPYEKQTPENTEDLQ